MLRAVVLPFRRGSDLPFLAFSPKFHASNTIRDRRSRGVSLGMSEVIIHDDESFDRALRRFKKKCEKAGILSDLRKHRHYEKPSEKRKRKQNAAQRKTRRTYPRVPRM
jgi:small subunit ribosomal protein S21